MTIYKTEEFLRFEGDEMMHGTAKNGCREQQIAVSLQVLRQSALDRSRALSEERIRETAEKLLPAIVSVLHANQVWVFGSTARGTATEDSDVDVFVECGDALRDLRWLDRQALAIDAISLARKQEYRFPCDIIVWTRDEVSAGGAFWRTVQKEGVRIYEH